MGPARRLYARLTHENPLPGLPGGGKAFQGFLREHRGCATVGDVPLG